jgi:hypothetical protein
MMTKINLLDITPRTSINIEGDIFYNFLKDNAINDTVVIYIPGNLAISSSFLNSSIGKFIDIFGMDKFRSNVKISSNKNIFVQIKKYVDFYNDIVK